MGLYPTAASAVVADLAPDQEIAVGLVRDHAAVPRLIQHRVAEVGAFDEPVVMKKDSPYRKAGLRADLDVPDEPVAGEIDEILEPDADAETRMTECYIADE